MATAQKQPSTTAGPAEPAARKAWVPKTPVDVVLEQIGKQEKRVATLQKERFSDSGALLAI